MRITKVETFKFWADWCNWLFVRVSTDEGLAGWGEGSLHGAIESVETAVRELSPLLVGAEFAGPEVHWQQLYHGWRWRGGAVQNTALSALDLALWDLEGKRLGVPVSRLLGGALRPRVRAYASHWLREARSPEEAHAGAVEALKLGYGGFKWSLSDRWDNADELGSLVRAGEFMAAAREGAGPTTEIFVECAERLSPRTALRAAEQLAPYRPGWFEEPIPFENAKVMADLQQVLPVPIATGERLLSRWEFRELLERSGCRIVQPDLMHAGGITEVRKIATMADTYYVSVAPHNPGGPIATLASIHLAAAIPNFLVLETMARESGIRDRICPDGPKVVDGHFEVPSAPGLGADLDVEAMRELAFQPQPLSKSKAWWA
ncbi:mandelate racemase/muconate lactonizing enzyme family protein [Actinopolymorpha pittospori]